MAGEDLYPQALVVVAEAVDRGATPAWVELIGTVAGPAGSSAVELPDGTVWEVDHTRPAQLVQLTLVAPVASSGASTAVLSALIGQRRTEQLARWPFDRSGRGRLLPERDEVPDRARPRSSRPPSSVPAGELGRLVLAADLLDDPAPDTIVRLCAGAELLVAVSGGGSPQLLAPLAGRVSADVAELAGRVDQDQIDQLAMGDPGAAEQVESLLSGLVGTGLLPRLPVEHVVRRLRRSDRHGPAVAGSNARVWPPAPAAPGLRVAESRSPWDAAPGQVADDLAGAAPDRDLPHAEHVGPGLLQVTVGRSQHGRWIRVLRLDGLVTLAVGPLYADGLLERARLAVPPDVPVEGLVVEVIDASGAAGPDGAASAGAEVIRDAVAAGRRAALAERVGRSGPARDAWLDAAARWESAGDVARASRARQYAEGIARRMTDDLPVPPLLADRVTLALAAPAGR